MSVFIQKLNPILRENTWENQDDNYDYHQEIARSSFADMLHDTERNQKYYKAIELAVNKMHSMGRPAKVLDIGTGTGILSMMAAKSGADTVIACESFAPISECAREVIRVNNLSDKIKIINKQSVQLTVGVDGDLPERANILVSEVFDTELIGEGALITFNHAILELLEDDPIVVPSSARVYAQVVESVWAHNWNNFKDVYDDDGKVLILAPDEVKECPGSATVHDIQLSQLTQSSFKEIVPPQLVAQFDWGKKESFKVTSGFGVTPVTAVNNGVAQAVFMWWELTMDTEHKIILSCAPYWAHPLKKSNTALTHFDIPWRDHWMQAVYFLSNKLNVQKGEILYLGTSRDQFSWWFSLRSESFIADHNERPYCSCGLHAAHSRTKIGLINDHVRNKKYLSVLEKNVNSESVVLVISDAFYLGLAATKLGAKKVFFLKEDYPSTVLLESFVKHNKITNYQLVYDIDSLISSDYIADINLVLAQPHFYTSILPWDSLFFAHLIKQIKSGLSKNCVIAPKMFSIKGIVVQFKDLQKIRLPLGAVEGFDLTPFDRLISDSSSKCDDKVEPHPLWEYPCIAKSDIKEFVKMNVEDLFEKDIDNDIEFEVYEKPLYNGVALWIDWDFEGNDKIVISTGPSSPPVVGEYVKWDVHTRQGVHFLNGEMKNEVKVKFSFTVKDANVKFIFS